MPGDKDRQKPSVTVDIVLLARQAAHTQVLLVQRRKPPFAGRWALPGGFVDPYEPLEAAARRELQEETGLEVAHLDQVHAFGDPGRDPRGWTISIAFLAILEPAATDALHPRAGSDAANVGWFDLDDLPPLAFDHDEIVAYAAQRWTTGA